MIKKILIAAVVVSAMASTSAFAACNEAQETQAGNVAAKISKDFVGKVVPVTGKQMINLNGCEMSGSGFVVDYKYNFLGADGLYWIEATAKFNADGSGSNIKVTKASPNMAAAEAKAGVKLASN